jgi:hypothetical protein
VSPAWDPPALLLVGLGASALVAWLVLSPPSRRAPLSAAIQAATAILLALTLVNAGWRSGPAAARPRLVVLVDRSVSMTAVGAGGTTRLADALAWLDGEAFSRMTAGWRVEIDSFGGSTTDPAAAIEAASATLPDAILVVSDGRATGGRTIGPAPVPLHARVPSPAAVSDAAVLGLTVEDGEEGGDRARASIEVAAVGGAGTPTRSIALLVDGAVVGRARTSALAAGERREIKVDLPVPERNEVVVEARLEAPADAVAGNDARARVWRPSPPGRTLLVGLAPGWEIGFLRRALAASATGPVDAYWGAIEGSLRGIDGSEAGAGWEDLDPARYEALWVIGDPYLLGAPGRRWVDRFAGPGGRGIFWGPGVRGGELAGLRVPAAGAAAPVPPDLTEAGRRWLEAIVGPLDAAPDGTPAWPPLEGLPAVRAELPGGSTVLLQAGGRPVAWSVERDRNRFLVALGTGWYRLALEGGPGREAPSLRFWRAWTEGAVRWLAAASTTETPLAAIPDDGRVAAGVPVEVRRIDTAGRLEWRVVPAGGGAAVASGVSEAGAESFAAGPLPAGAWRLEVAAAGRRESRALAVETWVPDLGRTEADTAALATAARASGGVVVGAATATLPSAVAAGARDTGRVVGLGLAPWAFLLATVLLLAHWAVAARAR